MATASVRDPIAIRVLYGVRRTVLFVTQVICASSSVVIAVVLLASVVNRYVLRRSLPWAGEFPSLIFPWLIMSGAVLAALSRNHLSVEYFMSKLPAGFTRWFALFVQLAVAAALVGVAWVSLGVLEVLGRQTTPVLRWSRGWGFAAMPVGFALLAIATLIEAILAFTKREVIDPYTGNKA